MVAKVTGIISWKTGLPGHWTEGSWTGPVLGPQALSGDQGGAVIGW